MTYRLSISKEEPNPKYNSDRQSWQDVQSPTLIQRCLEVEVRPEEFEAIKQALIAYWDRTTDL